jgi:hypothetical protein
VSLSRVACWLQGNGGYGGFDGGGVAVVGVPAVISVDVPGPSLGAGLPKLGLVEWTTFGSWLPWTALAWLGAFPPTAPSCFKTVSNPSWLSSQRLPSDSRCMT